MKTTELNTDKLMRDLRTITRDAEALVEATAGEVSDKARDARERLTDAIEAARAFSDDLKEKAVAGAKATDELIRDNPYKALGIAVAVGFVAGLLVNRNR